MEQPVITFALAKGRLAEQGAAGGFLAAQQRAQAVAVEREQLEAQLLQAQGNTTELRARELAKLDESNRALYDSLKAREDELRVLGERQGRDGQRYEVQIKGGGLTPFSRMGDGRAVLRSSIREFLCSEAMAGLGIPTSRALALVASRTPVQRESWETAAVVTRVAPSFVRFGMFEHFCHGNRPDALRQLADHVIAAHFAHCRDAPQPYLAWFTEVIAASARLAADWQAVGFCHGVLNTDNMSILGLTLDYGPFGFLDGFDPEHICNHSDHHGRYSYRRQPYIVQWNLQRLAAALWPLIREPELLAALEGYQAAYEAALAITSSKSVNKPQSLSRQASRPSLARMRSASAASYAA
jgi:hypothetical protein